MNSCEVWWGDSPMLADGITDVTITRSSPTVDEGVLSVPIFHSPLGVIMGRDHPLAQSDTVALAELRDEALKIWPRPFSPRFYDTIVSSLRDGGFNGPVEELAIFGSRLCRTTPRRAPRSPSVGDRLRLRKQYTSSSPSSSGG